jgi:hypothetical protein
VAITFLAKSSVVELGYQMVEVLACNLLGGTEENNENPIRIVGALVGT